MEAVIRTRSLDIVHVIGGSLFLALCAQIAIPFGPVPFSLQTLAVALLAMGQGSRLGTFSSMLYLVYAVVGLPFLAKGISNPLCLVGTTGGYLLSFPLVAFVSGRLFEKGRPIVALLVGSSITLILGTAVLSLYIGLQQAIVWGFLPFLPSSLCKAVAVLSIKNKCRINIR